MVGDRTRGMNDDFDAAFVDGFEGELPPSVDEAAVERMRGVAFLLDEFVRVPGTEYRVGVDPLLGSVPVVGDLVSGGLGLYIVLEAAYLGVSYMTVVRMLVNVAFDAATGSIPYVGALFDAAFKSNKRNLELALRDLGYDPERGRRGVERRGDDEAVTIEIEAGGD